MIYFVTSRKDSYKGIPFEDNEIELVDNPQKFTQWMFENPVVNLDTETSMVETGPMQHDNRILYVLQIGSIDQEDQFIFDMVDIEEKWIEVIRGILASESTFLAHNAKFDYLVLFCNLGVRIENVHDTFLMSRILNTGYDLPRGYHGLASCLKRFLNIDISKEKQTSFTGEPLTITQIEYAAIDVMFLYEVFENLQELLTENNLWYLYNEVERHVFKAYADMEVFPMAFDFDHWTKLSDGFIEEAKDLDKDLNKLVLGDPKLIAHLKRSKKNMGVDLIQLKDEYKINWASLLFKRKAFKILAPSLPEDIRTKPQIKKWLKDTKNIPMVERDNLNLYMTRDYAKLNDKLINKYKDFITEHKLFVKAGTLLINWASNQHKLFIFQHYYPKLDNTNAKSLVRIKKNPLINKFKKWVETQKRVTSYGKGFFDKYVRTDGRIAPFNCNQILNTGRISFGILLQMPAEAKFRNAFLPPFEDWVFVDTDYSSMEVLIAASAAKEQNFMNAVKKGLDLHSMSASLMFDDRWKDIAEENCEHLKSGKKCKCPEHLKLRTFSKTVTFGLFYGIGPMGLADRLGIEKSEAVDMIKKFFAAFPKFKKFFEDNEAYGIHNHKIVGLAPTNRIRFFHPPLDAGEVGSIGRASKNFPIQEASASILKIALIRLRKKILEEGLNMVVHLPIHDEILSSCHEDFVEEATKIQETIMIEAAEEFLSRGLISVDTNILKRWTKNE